MAALAAKQHGVVTSAQLDGLGITGRMIRRRLAAGRLNPVHRGVYAVGHAGLARDGVLHAAVLAVGGDAALSHVTAALKWGMLREDPARRSARIDVITTRRIGQRRGIRVHLTRSLPRSDLTRYDRIPITNPTRTLLDLASAVPENLLRRAVRQAEVDRLIDVRALGERLRHQTGCAGLAALRAIANAGPAPGRSELEDRTFELLRSHGLPRPRMNARVPAGDRSYEVDFLFAEQHVIIETDGARYHGTRLAREQDAAKQSALEQAGYRVIRLTWRQVTRDPEQTVRHLQHLLRCT